jgi:multidrug efflux pump subunit AcrA (membrane-fusion protein)
MLVRLSSAGAHHRDAVVVPRPALLEEEGVYSVFVLLGNRVEKRLVKPGILQDDRVEILTGVQPGETVVTEKAYSLEDGMEVVVKKR